VKQVLKIISFFQNSQEKVEMGMLVHFRFMTTLQLTIEAQYFSVGLKRIIITVAIGNCIVCMAIAYQTD